MRLYVDNHISYPALYLEKIHGSREISGKSWVGITIFNYRFIVIVSFQVVRFEKENDSAFLTFYKLIFAC